MPIPGMPAMPQNLALDMGSEANNQGGSQTAGSFAIGSIFPAGGVSNNGALMVGGAVVAGLALYAILRKK